MRLATLRVDVEFRRPSDRRAIAELANDVDEFIQNHQFVKGGRVVLASDPEVEVSW